MRSRNLRVETDREYASPSLLSHPRNKYILIIRLSHVPPYICIYTVLYNIILLLLLLFRRDSALVTATPLFQGVVCITQPGRLRSAIPL